MAWQSRFVYRNLIDGAITYSLGGATALSSLPHSNIAAFQPSEVFRTNAAPGATFQTSYGWDAVSTPYEIDTAWVGYTNATAHKNLLAEGNDFSEWAATNATPGADAAPPTLLAGMRGDVIKASGAGSVKHNIAQTWVTWASVTNNAVIDDLTASIYLAESQTDPVDKVRLAIINVGSGDETSVDIDLADGSTTAIAVTGTDFPTGDATATAFTPAKTAGTTYSTIATGYRLALHVDVATGGDLNNIRVEVRALMAGSESFSQAGEVFHCSGAQLEIGTTPTAPADNGADIGAIMTISATSVVATTDPTERWAYFTPRELGDWKADLGWVHGFARVWASPVNAVEAVFRIKDTGNLDAYFEIGRIVVGKSFKPTGAMVNISRDVEAGRSVWEITYEYVSASEAERNFLDMYRHCAKRSGTEVESAGGQRYSPGNKPVLFIADDAATTSEPERVIYGTLLGSQPVVNTHQTKYRATVRISELPK